MAVVVGVTAACCGGASVDDVGSYSFDGYPIQDTVPTFRYVLVLKGGEGASKLRDELVARGKFLMARKDQYLHVPKLSRLRLHNHQH